jgi:hypothetical protein
VDVTLLASACAPANDRIVIELFECPSWALVFVKSVSGLETLEICNIRLQKDSEDGMRQGNRQRFNDIIIKKILYGHKFSIRLIRTHPFQGTC